MEMAATCLVIDARMLESLSVEGPTLKVRMRSQSPRLFPLRRLSRVHVVGAIKDGLDSLLHCAENQIPVAFFSVSGRLRCQLYFPVYENSVLSHWLEHVDFDIEARQLYDDWLFHQTLHVISRMGYTEGACESRYQRIEEKLRGLCNRFLGKKEFHTAMDWLSGMLAVHISQLIVNYGLSNQSRGKRRLLNDISPICELWLIYFLATHASKRKVRIAAQSMSDFYQTHSEEIEYTVRRMLTQLATRLESIV